METFTVLHVHLILITLCGSKNYPYLPHGRDFSLDSPTSLEIPVLKASYIDLNLWAFENPPPPRNFQSLLWGEYGYFLELHISCSITLVMFGRFKHNLLLFPSRSSSKADDFSAYSCILIHSVLVSYLPFFLLWMNNDLFHHFLEFCSHAKIARGAIAWKKVLDCTLAAIYHCIDCTLLYQMYIATFFQINGQHQLVMTNEPGD